MTIEKIPFVRYTEGEKPKFDSFTIWINADERTELDYCKSLLQQTKDSTALKQLAHIGYLKLIGDHSTRWILGQFSRNLYNNKKSGVPIETMKLADSIRNDSENLTDL